MEVRLNFFERSLMKLSDVLFTAHRKVQSFVISDMIKRIDVTAIIIIQIVAD